MERIIRIALKIVNQIYEWYWTPFIEKRFPNRNLTTIEIKFDFWLVRQLTEWEVFSR